jgi:probable rRNA maturation factor
MEVNNLTDSEVDTNLLRKAVSVVLKGESKEEKKISIAIVGAGKMKELSRIYRHKDYATDVLSFFYNEKNFLGEIIICPEKIEKKEDFTKEICRVTIHGTLHLLGYNHESNTEEEGMMEKQEKYLQLVV